MEKRKDIDVDQWVLQYAIRRYGNIGIAVGENLKTAWTKLLDCCYIWFCLFFMDLQESCATCSGYLTGKWLLDGLPR